MISDSKTVYHAIFTILIKKGFQVWYDIQTADYWAEKEGWDFRASNFAALLGLIAIYEEASVATVFFTPSGKNTKTQIKPFGYRFRWYRFRQNNHASGHSISSAVCAYTP